MPVNILLSLTLQAISATKKDMLKQAFIRGLKIAIPIVITIAIVLWLLEIIEKFFKFFIPAQYYIPGMGFLFALVAITLLGLVMNARFISCIYDYFEERFKKIPGVKIIYGAIQDIMGFIDQSNNREEGSTVLVEVGNGIRVMGFITREDLQNLHIPGDDVCVYCPMSYQIGGYTVFIPKSKLHPVDLNTQEAMSFILTAGISKNEKK